MGLSARQTAFVREYLVDMKRTQAALRAGYAPGGAEMAAYRLMRHPQVRKAIEEAMAERLRTLDINGTRVLEEIARAAFADIRDVVTWKGGKLTLKDSDELSADVARAIASIKQGPHGLEVRMADKGRALRDLGEHLKLFTQVHDLNVAAGLASRVERAERIIDGGE